MPVKMLFARARQNNAAEPNALQFAKLGQRLGVRRILGASASLPLLAKFHATRFASLRLPAMPCRRSARGLFRAGVRPCRAVGRHLVVVRYQAMLAVLQRAAALEQRSIFGRARPSPAQIEC